MKNKRETRINIIRKLVELSNQKPDGFSSYDLERVGISRRTFRDHENYLIEGHRIEILRLEKKGKQERKYYQVTDVARILNLKFTSMSEIYENTEQTSRLIPLIGGHWNDLQKIFTDKILLDIFYDCIDNFKILRREMSSRDKPTITTNRRTLVSTINLPTLSFSIGLETKFYVKPTTELIDLYPESIKNYNNSKKSFNIINEFVFAFFYRLLSIISFEKINEFWRVPPEGYFKNYNNPNWEKEVSGKHTELVKIINNDPELKKIFDKGLKQILNYVKNTKYIEKKFKKSLLD